MFFGNKEKEKRKKNKKNLLRINIPSNAKRTFPAHGKSVKLPGRHEHIQLSMGNGHCHGDGSVLGGKKKKKKNPFKS